MSLFTPDPGLIFWMLITFLLVVLILGKFLWPFFLKSVTNRADFIEQGVEQAKEAAQKLIDAQKQSDIILEDARSQQINILNETEKIKNNMIEEAKNSAKKESEKILEDTQISIEIAKKEAFNDIKKEIINLTVQMSEKILREDLNNKDAQEDLINKMLNELPVQN